MTRGAVALGLGVALGLLGACGGGGKAKPADKPTVSNTAPVQSTPTTQFDQVMAQMVGFTDAMCRCQDTACANRVSDELTRWGQKMAKDQKDQPKLDEAQTKRLTDVAIRMGNCMSKAMAPPAAQNPPTP